MSSSRIPWFVPYIVLACVFCVLLAGGIGYWYVRSRANTQAKKDKDDKEKKEEEKKDFEVGVLRTLPTAEKKTPRQVKPGHWTSASQQMLANNFEFQATLTSAATDKYGNDLRIEKTRYAAVSSRPASLPKGEARHFETLFYVPRRLNDKSKQVSLQSTFRAQRGGRQVAGGSQPASNLKDHQYFFLVLAANADSYAFMDFADATQFHTEDGVDVDLSFYQVLRPKIDKRAPIPSNPLTWTSIAYVVWDDVKPNQLTLDQQTAMLDWLHFGGQLIISGPRSIDTLRGSFLNDYLPADSLETETLDQGRFAEMNRYFTIAEKKHPAGRPLTVIPDKPPLGAKLELRPGGEWVEHTGELVAEKRVGRGRVVITRFPLAHRQIRGWAHFDGFLNSCLLRRPGRRFFEDKSLFTKKMTFDKNRGLTTDPHLGTMVRYFTRDVDHIDGAGPSYNVLHTGGDDLGELPGQTRDVDYEVDQYGNVRVGVIPVQNAPQESIAKVMAGDPHYGGFRPSQLGGMASWNDFSGPSEAARQSLKDAAGISVPESSFVLQMMAIYLIVLVPVNWGFFRLIGKVEWAWIAAPIIAILGAVAVIRFAQLDIGFARSQTEIAVLETYSGYNRAHLTRYTALYTSLTTRYNIAFEEDEALALPFSANAAADTSGGYTEEVSYVRDSTTKLSGFHVASNTTGMMHAEEMFNLAGDFEFDTTLKDSPELSNGTTLNVKSAGVIRKANGKFEHAWIGDFSAGAVERLEFKPITSNQLSFPKWKDDPVTYSHQTQLEDLKALLGDEVVTNNGDEIQVTLEQLKKVNAKEFPQRDQFVEQFSKADRDNSASLDSEELARCCRLVRAGELGLGRLFDLAVRKLTLREGEARLIGWTDQDMKDAVFAPTAPQKTYRTMVLAHLQLPKLPPLARDVNHRSDILDDVAKETSDDPVLFPEKE